ncbi:MAG: DNA primase [Pseudomonadota bacterium]
MSLPPGFLDELRTRLSLADVVGKKVMWDTRKSNQGKGDWWAPCPFHEEKTASFHVDDRKGYYYCFGCHAKGDAITFVRETENVPFMEAVRILANDAGMQVPEPDPKAQEKADRRTQMSDVMEMAVRFFRMQLQAGAGAEARSYLDGRGLDAAALDRFEIGFAPPGWQNLWDALREKGISEELILATGLAKPSQKGKKPYDTFRNRIQFPIRDAQGRAIAFGGRAMDPEDGAKYLNSPETDLFDKGRSLYNHAPARAAAGKGHRLILAEGYMDVIALVRGGFEAAVAPLGTAITEEQLNLVWRIHPEPVIALDGDRAGRAAAMRLVDLALPLLSAERSLRFCLLPEQSDPDDILRKQGPDRLAELIEGAEPLIDLLWQRETDGKDFDSPERKAALDASLRTAIGRIADPGLRAHYGQEIKDRRWQLFRANRSTGATGGRKGRRQEPATALAATCQSILAQDTTDADERLREAVILATLITHPALIEEFEDALEHDLIVHSDHRMFVDALLRFGHSPEFADRLGEFVTPDALENLFRLRHVQISPGVRRPDDRETARLCIAEEFAKLRARRGADRELAEALEDVEAVVDEGLTWRLAQAGDARARAEQGMREDKTEYETGPNGARLSREERSAFDALLNRIGRASDD